MMDDRDFITSFAASEMQRINEQLKTLLASEVPNEDEKNALIADIEKTLARLTSAISHLTAQAASGDTDHDHAQ
ncbi:MAG: hypothetical protein SFT92_01405 [Rickettsiales bacterium]|nr:hypothetical protein [Rickettsiales bacterium]